MELKKLTKTQVKAIQKKLEMPQNDSWEKITVRFCASNINPENMWGYYADIDIDGLADVDKITNEFQYYNRINYENGRRVHYYLVLEAKNEKNRTCAGLFKTKKLLR